MLRLEALGDHPLIKFGVTTMDKSARADMVQRIENDAKTVIFSEWVPLADMPDDVAATSAMTWTATSLAVGQSEAATWHSYLAGVRGCSLPQQFHCCEYYGGLHDSSNCQSRNLVFYESNSYNNFDSSGFDQPLQYPIVHPPLYEMSFHELSMMMNLGTPTPEPLVNSFVYEESDDDIEHYSHRSHLNIAYTSPLPFLTTMEPTNTLLMGDEDSSTTPTRETDKFIKSSANDLVPIPRESEEFEDISSLDPRKSAPLNYEPLGNPDSVSRSLETSDLNLEELTTEIGLDDSIPTEIDNGYYDLEGDILFLEHLLIEETFSDPTPAVLPKKSTLLITPLPDSEHIFLREVERFDPLFSLTQSGEKTRVMETPSFGFNHMTSPYLAAYSPKEVMYRYYHPHLTSVDGFDPGPKK
ncbi:hypothetical protein Tco_0449351 [Tanacetum coccineum]